MAAAAAGGRNADGNAAAAVAVEVVEAAFDVLTYLAGCAPHVAAGCQ